MPTIESLNQKKYPQSLGSESIQSISISFDENGFIKKYEPQKVLIVYGTLAPNAPNHSKIEHIKGKWMKGLVRGRLEKEGWGAEMGYYGIQPDLDGDEIPAYMLYSDDLENHWTWLDEFEGKEYERILILFEIENGGIAIGNIYALKNAK